MPVLTGSELKHIYSRAKRSVRKKAAEAKAPLYYILDGVRYCEQVVQIDNDQGQISVPGKEPESLTSRTRPEMFVFAGCNGAGKTTLIDHFEYDFDGIVNADVIAQKLNLENPRNVDLSAGRKHCWN